MSIQQALVRSIRAEAIIPAINRWVLRVRIDYSWPEAEAGELREVAATVVALDPEGNVLGFFETSAARTNLCVESPEKEINLILWRGAASDSQRALAVLVPLPLMMSPCLSEQVKRQHADRHADQHADQLKASVSSGKLSRSSLWSGGILSELGFVFIASVFREVRQIQEGWPRGCILPGRAPRPVDHRALAAFGAGLALSDGCWLWLYSPSKRCLSPICPWSGSVARYEHFATQETSARRLVCDLTRCAQQFLCLSDTGAIWDVGGASPVLYQIAGVPLGWGTGKRWTIPHNCWRNWQGPMQWGVACGAALPSSAPRIAKNTHFAFLLERLCLCTEAVNAGAAEFADLARMSEDLTFGTPTVGSEDFRGGVVCMWAKEGIASSMCVSRLCREAWLREPASEPLYNAGQVAYVDKGGHLVITDLAAGAAVSCRVANPSLHCAHLALCADAAGSPLLIACHANLMASACRPQSAPGFALRVGHSWTFAPSGVPYVTCCTWTGTVRWSATLPVRALCCSAIGRRVFIGTLDGTLQIDAERGAFVKHYGQLPAVEILTVDTDTASILAARSDTGDIRVLEVPRE